MAYYMATTGLETEDTYSPFPVRTGILFEEDRQTNAGSSHFGAEMHEFQVTHFR